MAEFYPALEMVLDHEGGYQDHPDDLGNYNAYDEHGQYVDYPDRKGKTLNAGTNYGMSAGLYSSILKRQVSKSEMQALSREQAVKIYRDVYWNRIRGDEIPSQELANLLFDGHVNHGSDGIRLFQRVLNHLGAGLKVDGIVGDLTINAIKGSHLVHLYNGYLEARRTLYHNLAATREGNYKFLQGWLNRLKRFPALIRGASAVQLFYGVGFVALLWHLSGKKK